MPAFLLEVTCLKKPSGPTSPTTEPYLVSRRIRMIHTAKAVIRPTASAETPQNATS